MAGSHWLDLAALQARKPRGGGASLWSTIMAARRRWQPSTGLLSGKAAPSRSGEASMKLLGSSVQAMAGRSKKMTKKVADGWVH